jgi:hypothetical protein
MEGQGIDDAAEQDAFAGVFRAEVAGVLTGAGFL